MEDSTALVICYTLLITVPIHVFAALAIRNGNKKRRQLLMALWKMNSRIVRIRR